VLRSLPGGLTVVTADHRLPFQCSDVVTQTGSQVVGRV
jgi:hypothetical protein